MEASVLVAGFHYLPAPQIATAFPSSGCVVTVFAIVLSGPFERARVILAWACIFGGPSAADVIQIGLAFIGGAPLALVLATPCFLFGRP
jgi:hypothetical protein